MRNPIKQSNEAIETANIRIQETLDRVDTATTAATVAFALVGLVAVTALLLAASLVERR
jgi:hypothetical protein